MKNELSTQTNQLQTIQEPSVAGMLQTVIQQGITTDNVAALEQLVGLYERMQTKDAEKQFNSSFVNMQSELPVIVATSIIPNRGKYEKFEDIMQVVGPLMAKHGFAATFSQAVNENRIVETCHLMHVGGHSSKNNFAVRAGGKSDSETQADCKASTTAKRNALCNALNIVIRQDCLTTEDDAGIEGETISVADAENLRKRVKATKTDEAKFLNHAGATTFEAILSGRLAELSELLSRRENSKRAPEEIDADGNYKF